MWPYRNVPIQNSEPYLERDDSSYFWEYDNTEVDTDYDVGSELPHEAKVPYLVEDGVAITHDELYEYMKEKDDDQSGLPHDGTIYLIDEEAEAAPYSILEEDMNIADRVSKRVQADEASDAFKSEIQPFFTNKIKALLDELQDTIFEIQQGNWPSGWEYQVLRHKPMKMMNEDFLNAVVEQYIDWSNKVQDASE